MTILAKMPIMTLKTFFNLTNGTNFGISKLGSDWTIPAASLEHPKDGSKLTQVSILIKKFECCNNAFLLLI